MLVGARVLRERGGVDAGLGGEGRGADIGRVPVRRAVEQLVEGARDVGDLPQRLGRDADLEALGELGLQRERRDRASRDWRCRSARRGRSACPAPAARRRGWRRANWRRRCRCRYGRGCRAARRGSPRATSPTMRSTSCGSVPPLVSQSTAQRAPASIGRPGAGERIFGIGLVAVEEMLAVDHRLAAGRDGGLDAVGDAFEVLLERAAERDMDVIVPGLGDEHDRVGIRGEQPRDARIVADRAAGALGHAEGAEAGALASASS